MTKEELIKSLERKISIPTYDIGAKVRLFNGFDLNDCTYDFVIGENNVKIGQFFLYEKIFNEGGKEYLHYPKLALLVGINTIDMAVEPEFVNIRRSIEEYLTYECEIEGEKYTYFWEDRPTEIESTILWQDSINVYGIWDKMPNWKELKIAYDKTIWFHKSVEDKRDQLLNNIL